MTLPSESKYSQSQFNEMLNELRAILTNQLHDLRLLNDIADVIKRDQHFSISVESLKEYEDQLNLITEQQHQRFGVIDYIINEHILAVKKGIASKEQIVVIGKEARKTEAGIRTVKLFLSDVINMLNPNSQLVNRIDDRLQYFYKRSKELEKEIAILQARIK